MKKYLAIFLGTSAAMEAWKKLPEEEMKSRQEAGMKAWGQWMNDNQKSVLDSGSPLGKTKRVDKNGIADTKNEMGAWTVVQAESHDEAAKLFVGHPHYTLFPGESIEIMECIDIPKM